MQKSHQNKLPLISIVIPSYNKGQYIKETLESIVAQEYSNLEVIIQDGGSTDQTVNIIKKFAARYKFVKWESKKDKGQLGAINEGMRKARGDILAYINADDLYEKNAFREVAEVFSSYPKISWLAGKGRVVDEIGREIAKPVTQFKNLLLKINNYNLLLVVNYLMQPSVFISKGVYKKYGPFTGTADYVMEYDLWLKMGNQEMPKVLNKTLSLFRISRNSITSVKSRELLKNNYLVLRKYTNNPILILLHLLNNIGRLLVMKVI